MFHSVWAKNVLGKIDKTTLSAGCLEFMLGGPPRVTWGDYILVLIVKNSDE